MQRLRAPGDGGGTGELSNGAEMRQFAEPDGLGRAGGTGEGGRVSASDESECREAAGEGTTRGLGMSHGSGSMVSASDEAVWSCGESGAGGDGGGSRWSTSECVNEDSDDADDGEPEGAESLSKSKPRKSAFCSSASIERRGANCKTEVRTVAHQLLGCG